MQMKEVAAEFGGNAPGCAMMVLDGGRAGFLASCGCAELETLRSVDAGTNFRLASVSKHITATAILKLRDAGEISLDDTLERFFPHFPSYGKAITVEKLLLHTAGLVDYEDLLKVGSSPVRDEDVLSLLERENDTYFAPGTKFRYSNGGYCLLALIVARVARQSFPEFLRVEFFIPLGMDATYANVEGVTKIPNRAYGYSRRGDVWEKTDQDMTSTTIGDGGIYSSLADLSKWSQFLDSENFFERSIPTDEEGVTYGFGFYSKIRRELRVEYHPGSTIGFRTGLYRIPERKLTAVFLSSRNEGDGIKMCEEMLDQYVSDS